MTDAVLQLLRDRKQRRSTPGHRRDNARLVLLIEGGSSRGAISSGMTTAIEDLGLLPLFDAVYGSSAGALNGAWLLCGRATSTMHAWWDPMIMRATMDPRRALRRRPVVDTRWVVHTLYTEIVPMGFQEMRTKRTDESVTPPSRGERMVLSRWFARRAPGALDPWLRRVAIRAEEERLLASHPATLQIRPPLDSVRVGRTERRPDVLRTAVHTGRKAAFDELRL